MSNHNGIRFIKKWLPVLLWAAVIFFFSTEHFSAPQSSRILGPPLHWLFPDIGPEQVSSIQFAVRNSAIGSNTHFSRVALPGLIDDSRDKHSLRPAAWTMALALVGQQQMSFTNLGCRVEPQALSTS